MSERNRGRESPSLNSTEDEDRDKSVPTLSFSNGTVYWAEGINEERFENRSSGRIEVFPNWVRVYDPIPIAIPRDRVEYISSL